MKNKDNLFKKVFIVLIVIECVAIFGRLAAYANCDKTAVTFDMHSMICLAGEYISDDVFQIDSGENGVVLQSVPLQLDKGVYRIQLAFDADSEAAIEVKDLQNGYRSIEGNAISLHSRERSNSTGFTFYLHQASDDVVIQLIYGGEGLLRIDRLELVHTGQEYTTWALLLVLLSICIDISIWVIAKYYRGKICSEQVKIGFGMVSIVFFASYPLLMYGITYQDDLYFHLTRIQGILDAWKSGQFPARMQPNWLNGMGYPVSVMYGDLLLWPVTIIYAATGNIVLSLKWYVFFINVVTEIVTYDCLKKMFRHRRAALVGSALYLLAIYRLNNIYLRGAVGEYSAMLFLPIVALGITILLDRKTETKEEAYRGGNYLAIGFGGLVLTHVLTFELCALITALIFLIFYKKTFRRYTLVAIVRAAAFAILGCCWFLVPFLDYAYRNDFLVYHIVISIQECGIYFSQLISLFQWSGANAFVILNGMQNVRPLGLGIALVGVMVTYFYLKITGRIEKESRFYNNIMLCAWRVAVVTGIASLIIFPWDLLASVNGHIEVFISSIQKPYRLLVFTSLAIAILGAGLVVYLSTSFSNKISGLIISASICVLVLQTMFFADSTLQSFLYTQIYNPEAFGTEYVGGAEYMMNGVDYRDIRYNTVISEDEIIIEEYEKEYGNIRLTANNPGMDESYVDVTLLYYPGYKAVVQETGEQLELQPGEKGSLRVVIPKNFSGTILISFEGFYYWKIANGISGIFLLFVIVQKFVSCRKRAKEQLYEA